MPEVTLKAKPEPHSRVEEHRTTGMTPLKSVSPTAPASEQPQVSPEQPAQPDPRMQALEKRERALRAQAKRFQMEKSQWEAQQKASLQPSPQQPSFSKEQFLKDPTSLGVSYEDIAHLILNQPSQENQAIKAITDQINALRTAQEESKAQQAEQAKLARANAVKQISREVNALVSQDESFDTIKTLGKQDAVTALIELTYDEEGYVMKTEDAAQEVENYLIEEGLKYTSLKKIKDKINPTEQQSSPKQQTTPTTLAPTLTHAATQPATKALSPRERRERAVAAFRGTLK